MPIGIRKQPWLGKCGTMHFPRQPCKVCIRKWNRPKPKPKRKLKDVEVTALTKAVTRAEKCAESHRELLRKHRALWERFLLCWTLNEEGFHLYKDQWPELLAVRRDAEVLRRTYINKQGGIYRQ